MLIVGGGNVGLEKLSAILSNSPATKVRLVAPSITDEIKELANEYPNVELFSRPFTSHDLVGVDVVIVAVNDQSTSERIRDKAKEKGKLVNVADKPELCDFYMSSIVKKGSPVGSRP